MVDTGDMCQVEDTDEWRSGSSSTRGKEQELVIVRQVETNEQEAENINDGNAPEGILYRARHGLTRIGSLRGGKTDELGARKGEGGSDEDSANAFKAVGKCSWVVPILGTDILAICPARGAPTAIEDDGDKYEHGDDEQFEA